MDPAQQSKRFLLIGGIALVVVIFLLIISLLSLQQAEYLKTGVITPGISPLPPTPEPSSPAPILRQCRDNQRIRAGDQVIESCNPCEPDVPSLCVAESGITTCDRDSIACEPESHPQRSGKCEDALGYDSSKSCDDQRVRSVRECSNLPPSPFSIPFTVSPCLELPGLPCPTPTFSSPPPCEPVVSTAFGPEIKCVMDEEAGEREWVTLENPENPSVDYNQCDDELSHFDVGTLESLPPEDRLARLEEICRTRSAVMHKWFMVPYTQPYDKYWPPPTTTFSCRPKSKSTKSPMPETSGSTSSPTPTPPPTPTPTSSPTPSAYPF